MRHRKRLNTLASVLNDRTDTALHSEKPEHLQDNVLRAHVVGERTHEIHTDDPRHGYIVCAATHSNRYVEAARTHGKHADAARGRGVAVRAYQGLARG